MRTASAALIVVALSLSWTLNSGADSLDLLQRSCPELIKMAQSYQDDEKMVNTVLSSAIDAGTMERVRKYKLKKAHVKKNLAQIMKAIEIKGCVAP
jgi:hypothetical protein